MVFMCLHCSALWFYAITVIRNLIVSLNFQCVCKISITVFSATAINDLRIVGRIKESRYVLNNPEIVSIYFSCSVWREIRCNIVSGNILLKKSKDQHIRFPFV